MEMAVGQAIASIFLLYLIHSGQVHSLLALEKAQQILVILLAHIVVGYAQDKQITEGLLDGQHAVIEQ